MRPSLSLPLSRPCAALTLGPSARSEQQEGEREGGRAPDDARLRRRSWVRLESLRPVRTDSLSTDSMNISLHAQTLLQLRDLAAPGHPPRDAPVARTLLDVDVRHHRRHPHDGVARRRVRVRPDATHQERRPAEQDGPWLCGAGREDAVVWRRAQRGSAFLDTLHLQHELESAAAPA